MRVMVDFSGGVRRRPVGVKVYNSSKNPLPQYKTHDAAACDICSAEDVAILTKETRAIRTGLFMEIPPTWKISILPRSGLSLKGVTVANSPGTIDADYRGELMIIMTNNSAQPFLIRMGDRIAQMEIVPTFTISWEPVEGPSQLSSTERGEGGLGSTGGLSEKPIQEGDSGQQVGSNHWP